MRISRFLILMLAIAVLGTAALHVALPEAPATMTYILAGAQALIAIAAILFALGDGGSGPSLKRFRLVNTSGDQVTNVSVQVIDMADVVKHTWNVGSIANNTRWAPPDTVVNIADDNGDSGIVKYVIQYTRNTETKRLEVDCPNHTGNVRHDIEEVWGALERDWFHRAVEYRDGTWDDTTLSFPANASSAGSQQEVVVP